MFAIATKYDLFSSVLCLKERNQISKFSITNTGILTYLNHEDISVIHFCGKSYILVKMYLQSKINFHFL